MFIAHPQQQFGGDWTEEKLGILREYLDRYTTALKYQPFDLVYVDAFAGTGYRQLPEEDAGLFADYAANDTQCFLDGSARKALEIRDKPFDRFVFIENDPGKCEELKKLRGEHADQRIEIVRGDANRALTQWCGDQDWRRQRAVLFLDPFATQVRWDTIDAVAETKSIDTWILFPVGAIQRMLPKNKLPEQIDAKWQQRLDLVFGSPEWHETFYARGIVENHLFDPKEVERKIATAEVILDYFIRRLGEVYADVCRSYRVLRNSRNSALFGFCFAVGNPRGAPIAIPIAQHILGRL